MKECRLSRTEVNAYDKTEKHLKREESEFLEGEESPLINLEDNQIRGSEAVGLMT